MKFNLIKLKSVNSTNDEAIKLIKKNESTPCIITANFQKKGRGTMGKKWVSKKGNLFMSLFFELKAKKISPDQFAILNPFIIKNVLRKYSIYKISIKWPNDLLVNKKKLCGILQEVITHKKKKFLIIGIGINTKISPRSLNFQSTSLLNCSNHIINNNKILINIKKAYEKFVFN